MYHDHPRLISGSPRRPLCYMSATKFSALSFACWAWGSLLHDSQGVGAHQEQGRTRTTGGAPEFNRLMKTARTGCSACIWWLSCAYLRSRRTHVLDERRRR
ncbi:hypothetical protein OH77DRAFT_326547 [Trametes cingulata]|nr:hypothetical protein OH77DRAFT_326547 [Trametes cingulata]